MKPALLFLLAASAWAQIDPPKLGLMLDRSGTARPVFGLTGSVTVGTPVLTGVLSSGCSASFCLAKTATSIVSPTGSIDAPSGPALFAFEGNIAFVYFPHSRQLARWHDNELDPVDFEVTGEILSIYKSPNSLRFAVRRADGNWIVRNGDSAVAALPQATGPVTLLDQRVLYATPEAVILRQADASELRFPLAGAQAFSLLGPGYVQIHAGRSIYALRVDPGREQLFQLPGAAR